jgi:hypothetical protein
MVFTSLADVMALVLLLKARLFHWPFGQRGVLAEAKRATRGPHTQIAEV